MTSATTRQATRPDPERAGARGRRRPVRHRFLAAGLVCLVAAGCGEDSEQPDTTTAAATATPPPVEKYLLEPGDVPDLEPRDSPFTDTGEPFPLDDDGRERLEKSGYISTTYQPAEGKRAGAVSSVVLFETEAGARDWMAYETSDEGIKQQVPDAEIKRFKVRDVPGAHGWTGPDRHGNATGHVYWTQGRCMLLIGLETRGRLVEPLSTGVKAIYDRTEGRCP